MPIKFDERKARDLNAILAPHLSDEARKAVNEAFDAISNWRTETLSNSEKNSDKVIEKMAAAAQALGWPQQIADAIREQLQAITKMQIETLDRMMDLWEEQIKSPNPMTASTAMLERLKSLPNISAAGTWPIAGTGQGATNPLQLYGQLFGQWQQAWTDAMTFWAKAGKPSDPEESRRRRS